MLITSKDPNSGKLYQVQWSPGHSSPFKDDSKYSIYYVGEVEIVNEEEKHYISVMFPGMIIPNTPTIRYFGDDARFIAGNLP